ncbi:MAG: hypothetical protein Wins2KO_22630 [Winogradskyella sp.]
MKNNKIAYKKFIASGVVLGLAGVWTFLSNKPINGFAYVLLGFLILIGLFSLSQGIRALKDEKQGLLPVDEFSKKAALNAAANTFYFSIVVWLIMILFVVDQLSHIGAKEAKVIIFSGLAITAIFFLISRMYYTKTGISDED